MAGAAAGIFGSAARDRAMMKSVCKPTFPASHLRRALSRGPLKSFWNSAFEFHGLWRSSATAGGLAPCCLAKAMNGGQLSAKRPLEPAGYQMKWPIPSEGTSSPPFHVVSPETLPAHSFCQIFRPIAALMNEIEFPVQNSNVVQIVHGQFELESNGCSSGTGASLNHI